MPIYKLLRLALTETILVSAGTLRRRFICGDVAEHKLIGTLNDRRNMLKHSISALTGVFLLPGSGRISVCGIWKRWRKWQP